jgi:hypothetical protein
MIAPTDSEEVLRILEGMMKRASESERDFVVLWLDLVVYRECLRRGDDAGAALVTEVAGRIAAGDHLGQR